MNASMKKPDVIRACLETGRVSAWRSPNLVDACIQNGFDQMVSLIPVHVRDLKEEDLAKLLLFALTHHDQAMLMETMRLPFRRPQMISFVKGFGTIQLQALLDVLLGMLGDATDGLALRWIALLMDAHYTLFVLQPAFLSQLKALHEAVAAALLADEMAEALSGLIKQTRRTKPKKTAPVSKLYALVKGIDL